MKKLKVVFPVLILLFLIGCGQQTITPIDRAFIYQNQYDAIEQTYKNQYMIASEMEKEWLRTRVAPIIDSMRIAVACYTKAAIAGGDDEMSRLEIMQLYRKAALRLTKEVAE